MRLSVIPSPCLHCSAFRCSKVFLKPLQFKAEEGLSSSSGRIRVVGAFAEKFGAGHDGGHALLSNFGNSKVTGGGKGLLVCRVSEKPDVSSNDDAGLKQSEARARFVAQKVEAYVIEEKERPLGEYMSLPASQYSVLDAERIERVDENTFLCYIYRLKFFMFEICPVLLVRVDEKPDGCCIRLLSASLDGSPIGAQQNKKFSVTMVNNVSWRISEHSTSGRELISDATIEVSIELPLVLRPFPVETIEATGRQVLSQVLRVMLPRFLSQLGKDYYAWASGDESRRPLGTGEI